jgi:tripartite-type tricarboxylate transporter receptor subunit TctC
MTLHLQPPVRLATAIFFMAAAVAAAPAIAQEFPNRPIRLIVGPGPDTTARAIGAKLGAALGQAIVVEQLPAAGGVVAAQTVAKAAPDGYTLLLTTGSYSIMQAIQPGINFNLQKDFEPVAQIASLGFVLLAHPDVAASSLAELTRLAREKPGTLNCASTGIGTTAHLGCEMFRTYGKIDFVHVPFKGNPPAVADLLAGRVHFFFSTGPAVSHVQAGKLKALAVTGPTRMAAIPAVPTVAEAGMPELSFISWNGVHAPAGTPKAVTARLGVEITKAATLPDIQKTLTVQGFDPDPKGAEAFGAFVRADVERWARVVAETGAKAQ